MRGLGYLIAYPFTFIGCLLTTLIFQLFWITFEFNSIVTETLGIQLAENLQNPSYWDSFWVFMLAGFLRFMFFPFNFNDTISKGKE